jgi:hypothetical protein
MSVSRQEKLTVATKQISSENDGSSWCPLSISQVTG